MYLKCSKYQHGNTWNAKQIFSLNERKPENVPYSKILTPEEIFSLLGFLQLEKLNLGDDPVKSLLKFVLSM